MYCPSCKSQIPDNSTFCNHCGTNINSPALYSVIEWEYRDYAWNWPVKGRGYVPCSRYTGPAALYEFWQACQRSVIQDLEELAKEGWRPVVDDLPSGVQIRSYKALRLEAFGWIMYGLLIVSSFGLALLFMPFMRSWYYEPTGYNIQLKRPKR